MKKSEIEKVQTFDKNSRGLLTHPHKKTLPKSAFSTEYSIVFSLQRLFTTKIVYDNRKPKTKANPVQHYYLFNLNNKDNVQFLSLIKGFKSKNGKSFDAALKFDDSFQAVFDFPK